LLTKINLEMSDQQLPKETYRSIVESYFRAFEYGDFSDVQFSTNIQFLSPISGTTMNGRTDVVRFVTGVSSRVTKVNIISTAIDFPTASGVWQMTTTKGVQYTLHNFFRLDHEGILYIWPMFDPKAVMSDPPGLLQWLRGEGYYDVVATTPKQPAGVAISKSGRLFVNFPRWVDEPTPSVAEILEDGSLLPYPNAEINRWNKTPGHSARTQFVCVQSVVIDESDYLWILDPASPLFTGVIHGGAKLLKINLHNNTIERIYYFSDADAPEQSYLNDVRFAAGFAFITDSGLGAIVVVNLDNGKVRRLLHNHQSTKAEADVEPIIGGNPWKFADNTTPQVHSDGIAIDPKREYIYYKALVARTLYRVPVSALVDDNMSDEEIEKVVETVAITEPTDGFEFDTIGNLYMTSLEWNAIKVMRPDGRIEVLARSTDFLWPDTISISDDGSLIFTATQFHQMPAFNNNIDKRTPPYKIFRLKLQ
jgi:sugar lactone lactonase YvrE